MSDKPENFEEWYAKEWAEYCGTITPKSMMKIAFKAGADLAKPIEWISVDDDMPCKSDDVILWNGSDREIYLCYEREHFEAYYKDITHWALLIEPPIRETP